VAINRLNPDYPDAGTVQLIPGSVAVGSGSATVNGNGQVSFSGSTSVSLNNVFSSIYVNYLVIVNMTEVATSGNLGFRVRVSGSDAVTNYNSMVRGIDTAGSALAIAGSGLTSAQYVNQNAGANSNSISLLTVGTPFETRPTQITIISATRRAGGNWSGYNGGINHTDNTSYTGFTLLNDAGGNITGTVSIYGYRN
jgi:hypothetical protein